MSSSRGIYRGVYSSLFDDPDFQHLTPEARLALLVVRQCKQAGAAAIFRFYPAVLVAQTGLAMKTLDRALGQLVANGWIEREDCIIWVRNGLRYDPHVHMSNPKHFAGVQKHLQELPRLPIILRFCDYYSLPYPFDTKATLNRIAIQQEKDTDTDTDSDSEKETASPPFPPPGGAEGEAVWGRPEDLVALYNTEAPDNVSAVEELSPKRREKARRALRQYPREAWWREVFAEYRRSRFLSGRTKPRDGHENFRPDFDWLLSNGRNGVENYIKVHDGMYRD